MDGHAGDVQACDGSTHLVAIAYDAIVVVPPRLILVENRTRPCPPIVGAGNIRTTCAAAPVGDGRVVHPQTTTVDEEARLAVASHRSFLLQHRCCPPDPRATRKNSLPGTSWDGGTPGQRVSCDGGTIGDGYLGARHQPRQQSRPWVPAGKAELSPAPSAGSTVG